MTCCCLPEALPCTAGIYPIYKILIPRHGSMASRANREKIVATWLRSKGFRRTGLGAEQFSPRIVNECKSGGDFIRRCARLRRASARTSTAGRFMTPITFCISGASRKTFRTPFSFTSSATAATSPSRSRKWPASLLCPGIAAKPTVWSPPPSTGSGWSGVDAKPPNCFPADYIEVHYEDLITNPRETLGKLGGFIDHDLDYDRIQQSTWVVFPKPILPSAKKQTRKGSIL